MPSKRVVVEGSTISAPQLSEFWKQVSAGSISGEVFQHLLDRRNPFPVKVPNILYQLQAWLWVYEIMGVSVEPRDLAVPTWQPGFDWMVMVAKEITLGAIIGSFEKLTSRECKQEDPSLDLDGLVQDWTNEPDPSRQSSAKGYVAFMRSSDGPDEDLRDCAASDVNRVYCGSLATLKEVLLMQNYLYHCEDNTGMDTKGTLTICAGSKISNGVEKQGHGVFLVPTVTRIINTVKIGTVGMHSNTPYMGARRVIRPE